MITLANETTAVKQEYAAWVVTTDADKRDAVLTARVDGYVRKLEMSATMEAMREHMSDCRAKYVTAWDMDLWLSQETAFGMKWGIR